MRSNSRFTWARLATILIAAGSIGFVSSSYASSNEPSADAQALFLKQNQDALKQLAAEYLSTRFDFLDVKYLQPDAPGGQDGWALAYRWDAEKISKQVGVKDGQFTINSMSYNLNVDGSYALGNTKNTSDLSTVTAAFKMERGNLGRLHSVTAAKSAAFQDCLAKLSDPTDPNDTAAWRLAQQAEDACWATHGIDRIIKGDDSAYYYWFDFHGGIEGNQDYSNTHSVYGFNFAAAFQPTQAQAKYNVLDWPFRLLRAGFGTSSNYIAPLPSIRLSVEQVQARDDLRQSVTTGDKFTRATGELAFQTRVATLEGQAVRFNLSYRYFYELNAPPAVKRAGLDGFSFATASLRFPAAMLPLIGSDDYEFFVGYNKGHLPFDQASDQSIEIGISTNIKLLGALLRQ